MKAYEAGIKLAAHEFFGKFADGPTDEQKAQAKKIVEEQDLFSSENSAKASKKLKEINPEFAAKYPGQGEKAPAAAPAPQNAGASFSDMISNAGDYMSNMFGGEDASASAPAAAPAPQNAGASFMDSLDSYRSYLPSLPTEQQAMDMVSNAGNNIMSGLSQAGDYISNMFGGGGATEPAPKTPLEYETAMARNYIPEAQPQPTGTTEPAPEKPMGPPRELQNFTAVRGGYGKQLKALRGMGGLSQDARDLLGQTNYRQLASAMGNRGLRVGDQFSVQDLLGRLRGQQARRDQGASSGEAIGSKSSPISIQNRRGSTVNRGALRQRPQRPAAPQAPAPRPNVRSMVNQLGIKPNQPLKLGPAPSQANLLKSVGAPQAPAAPKPQQGLMGGLQDFPSNIGAF